MRARLLALPLLLLLALPTLTACDSDSSGGTTGDARFPDLVVAPTESALVGRIVRPDGTAWAGIDVAACSDFDCPIQPTDDGGFFVFNGLPPDRPRRLEIFGRVDQYPSVVFRREFVAGEAIDVGDVIVPDLAGGAVEWKPETGGTVALAGGRLELTAPVDVLDFPLGTVDFVVQAAPFSPAQLPNFDQQPWIGKEDRTIGFGLLPFDIHAEAPLEARVTSGLNAAPGDVFDVYHVDTKDGILTLAGTATADASGVVVTDSATMLQDITFILFVGQACIPVFGGQGCSPVGGP